MPVLKLDPHSDTWPSQSRQTFVASLVSCISPNTSRSSARSAQHILNTAGATPWRQARGWWVGAGGVSYHGQSGIGAHSLFQSARSLYPTSNKLISCSLFLGCEGVGSLAPLIKDCQVAHLIFPTKQLVSHGTSDTTEQNLPPKKTDTVISVGEGRARKACVI